MIRLPEYCERLTVSERQGRRCQISAILWTAAGWNAKAMRPGDGIPAHTERMATWPNLGQTRPE